MSYRSCFLFKKSAFIWWKCLLYNEKQHTSQQKKRKLSFAFKILYPGSCFVIAPGLYTNMKWHKNLEIMCAFDLCFVSFSWWLCTMFVVIVLCYTWIDLMILIGHCDLISWNFTKCLEHHLNYFHYFCNDWPVDMTDDFTQYQKVTVTNISWSIY